MKIQVIMISILILCGLGYFAWQNSQDTSRLSLKNPTDIQTGVRSESQTDETNQNTNQNKNEGGEKENIIINTITGENVPEGFYDEVLADGYTYNNPKPFDISIVTPNENPDVPGYITEDQMKNLSESWLVPSYPFEEYTGDFMYKYTMGTIYHKIDIDFPYNSNLAKMNGKEAFTKWFQLEYGYDFVFVRSRNYTNSSKLNKYRYWNILITGESLYTVKSLSSNLEEKFSAGSSNSRYRLHIYQGTELEKIAREKAQELFNRTLN